MKKTLSILILIIAFSVAHAQKKQTDSVVVVNDADRIYQVVEQYPTFPGGMKKWFDYVKENLKYPDAAKKDRVQGRVFVSFVVERDGTVTNPKVVRGIGDGCDEEAWRLLKNSPKWNPGLQGGQPVRVQYMVPVEFRL